MQQPPFRQHFKRWLGILGLCSLATSSSFAAKTKYFEEEHIPVFNIPQMQTPPIIDGNIDDQEWASATKMMGMVIAHGIKHRERHHSFWVSWDAKHLYIAGRAHVIPKHTLLKAKREKFTTGVVFDDAFEFGISMEGRNQIPGEEESFLKFIVNALKSGEYLKMYPSIGQYLYNWKPELDIETKVYQKDGAKWFDIEIALDLDDLQMPVENQVGDHVRMLFAHDGKNPGWQWTCVPTASGYLVHEGYPRAVLTANEPYVQVNTLKGLMDEKIEMKTELYNPSDKPIKVDLSLDIHNKKFKGPADIADKNFLSIQKTVEIPAKSSLPFDVSKTFPGMIYGQHPTEKGKNDMRGFFSFVVKPHLKPKAKAIYNYHMSFVKDTEKKFLKYDAKPEIFYMSTLYNPANHKIWIEADTLDAQVPQGTLFSGASYRIVDQQKQVVAKGVIKKFIYHKYQDLIQCPKLSPGKYEIEISLLNDSGKALVTRSNTIEKKDESKAFPEWWGKKFGNPEQIMKPFEPLKVENHAGEHTTKVSPILRDYYLDPLGLPQQIQANGGSVFNRPSQICLVIDGQKHIVPNRGRLVITEQKDWRVSFEGPEQSVAGVRFKVKGHMEQDGLVTLSLQYAPIDKPVHIQEMRIEWPVDDRWNNHIAVIGVGGNYSARYIGAIPKGNGEVFNTLKHIGKSGSGMTLGNFYQNLWIGNEKRGLLWYGTSDKGWVPNDKAASHSILRKGGTTTIRNHIISTPPGEAAFKLESQREIRFGYNASPFKKLTKGWRYTQRSAANGFTKPPKFKVNWDTGTPYFTTLSPPFRKKKRWPEYYAHCKEVAEKMSYETGLYDHNTRLMPYLTNQIALRGYARKSQENDVYNYFKADWETLDSGETLNETYRDYMMYIQDRGVKEGGLNHYYYDISFAGSISKSPVAGMGYVLPDGRLQPGGKGGELRTWYMRSYALMQENGLPQGAISGHATHTIPLVALPFCDAILDSEFPMIDPITVYTSDYMIAMSHPQNFGININHLGFMNENWSAMHDAGQSYRQRSVFMSDEFRHWGIEREDIEFVPYWRNDEHVHRINDGVLCSMWKKPGSAILGILNYGLDKKGFHKKRSASMNLNLKALGVPDGVKNIRAKALNAGWVYNKMESFDWYKALPGTTNKHNGKVSKYRPDVEIHVDAQTGALSGFDINYHDTYFVALYWDEPQTEQHMVAAELKEWETAALNWGLRRSELVLNPKHLQANSGIQAKAWKQKGQVMVYLKNTSNEDLDAKVQLDHQALDVKVETLWAEFTSIIALDNKPVLNGLLTPEYREKSAAERQKGSLVYDGHLGQIEGRLKAGESRLVSIDNH